MIPEVLSAIQERGHWRVNFRPLSASHRMTSPEDCRELVQRNIVELREWDYPHFPRDRDKDTGLKLGKTFCEAWIDRKYLKEFWRMYQSGQFIHYVALWEDWDTIMQDLKDFNPGERLSLAGTVRRLTEVFEFAARLARDRSGIYTDGMLVAVSLRNTRERELWLHDPNRIPLTSSYRSKQDQVDLGTRKYSAVQVLKSSKQEAFAAIVRLFRSFGWAEPNLETVKEYQERLLGHEARQE